MRKTERQSWLASMVNRRQKENRETPKKKGPFRTSGHETDESMCPHLPLSSYLAYTLLILKIICLVTQAELITLSAVQVIGSDAVISMQ